MDAFVKAFNILVFIWHSVLYIDLSKPQINLETKINPNSLSTVAERFIYASHMLRLFSGVVQRFTQPLI